MLSIDLIATASEHATDPFGSLKTLILIFIIVTILIGLGKLKE